MPALTIAPARLRLRHRWRAVLLLVITLVTGSALTLLAGSSLQRAEALRLASAPRWVDSTTPPRQACTRMGLADIGGSGG